MVESMVEPSDLAYELHIHFLTNGFKWNGDTPSAETIEEALRVLRVRLENEPDNTTIFGGRLAVQKNGKRHDVYAHFGDYNDSTV